MRQIMAEQARSTTPAIVPDEAAGHRVPSQDHPLLGRPAPALVLKDTRGKTWNLRARGLGRAGCGRLSTWASRVWPASPTWSSWTWRSRGSTSRARGCWRSAATPPSSRGNGFASSADFQIPLLSDPDHATSLAYGVWKPVPGGDKDDGEALHGTFIVDRDGLVRWAYVGDRPFTDIEALLTELDSLRRPGVSGVKHIADHLHPQLPESSWGRRSSKTSAG